MVAQRAAERLAGWAIRLGQAIILAALLVLVSRNRDRSADGVKTLPAARDYPARPYFRMRLTENVALGLGLDFLSQPRCPLAALLLCRP